MTWKFERVAGPYKGMTGGVVWDGTRILFSAVQEECILKFDPQTGGIEGLCLDSGGNIMAMLDRQFVRQPGMARPV